MVLGSPEGTSRGFSEHTQDSKVYTLVLLSLANSDVGQLTAWMEQLPQRHNVERLEEVTVNVVGPHGKWLQSQQQCCWARSEVCWCWA